MMTMMYISVSHLVFFIYSFTKEKVGVPRRCRASSLKSGFLRGPYGVVVVVVLDAPFLCVHNIGGEISLFCKSEDKSGVLVSKTLN